MVMGQGISLLMQVGYFVVLARLLGVKEYGVFAGAFALASIVMPYSGLGSGTIFMRYVGSGSGDVQAYWGNILLSTLTAGSMMIAVLWVVAPHLISPASASIIALVAASNCLFGQLVASMGQVFQAFEQLRMTALLNLLTNFLRFATVVVLAATLPRATAGQWACASLFITFVAAAVGFLIVVRRFGRPKFVPRMVLANAKEGLSFSLGGSAQSVYNDVDKTLLSHFNLNAQNGIYTMAYRVVDMASIPLTAIDSAALPRYFRVSGENLEEVPPLAFRLARKAGTIGAVVSCGLFLAAGMIPHVVGESFAESVLALRWLCLIPAFRGLHQLTGSAITGMGYQRFRTVAQFSAAGFNLILNLWLIPKFGWLGAAWASLATDGTLVVINWGILRMLPR
jgi:O-antigen/teichoic acid export membrane protein